MIDAVHGKARRAAFDSVLGRQVKISYELPLAEVVMDFFDRLKSVSRGYASFDYEFREVSRRRRSGSRLDILINGDRVDALSVMVHRAHAQYFAAARSSRGDGRSLIPRQMFDVAMQAADRRPDHRARNRQGAAKERTREVLRWRRDAQAQAAGKAESRQEADEGGRQRRDSQEAFSPSSVSAKSR